MVVSSERWRLVLVKHYCRRLYTAYSEKLTFYVVHVAPQAVGAMTTAQKRRLVFCHYTGSLCTMHGGGGGLSDVVHNDAAVILLQQQQSSATNSCILASCAGCDARCAGIEH